MVEDISGDTATVVEDPSTTTMSSPFRPNYAIIASKVSEVVASIVDADETATTEMGAEITIAITYIVEPLPTTVVESRSYVVTSSPVATGVSGFAPSVNSTATSTTKCDDMASASLPVPTITPTTVISNHTTIVHPVVTSVSNSSVSSAYPTLSIISSALANTTISSNYTSTRSVVFNTTSTITSGATSLTTSTKSKTKSKTWTSLSVPTSVRTFVRASTSNSLPSITSIPTTPCSSLLLSFTMPTYSSRKATTTSIIDLSTLPANVSANTPCYEDNCPNPDSGMNYNTTVSGSLDIDNTLFTGEAVGMDSGLTAAAVLVFALWGVVLLL